MTHEQQPGQRNPGESPRPAPLSESGPAAETTPRAESGQANSPERREEPLQPRIWVGSLLDYNSGILHGEWIDAAQDDQALGTEVQRVLAASPTTAETGDPAEEYGIFDYDDFGVYRVQEYDRLEDVARVALGVAEHGPAFAAWADLHDGHLDMLAGFTDAYMGEYDSPEAWAETVMDDLGIQERLEHELHGDMARYVRIDTGAWVQDAWLSGDIAIIHKPGGGVWIFDGR